MAISTIAEIEHLHNVHSGSPQTTQCNPPQITKIYSMIFKQQLTDISTVLNNTGNTTKLLTSFNALDIAQQKVLLSSSLLSEKQKEQCITMAALSAANTKYTAEQLAKATGISTETLANWGLIESTDALTISELAQRAASDAQAKAVLDKIIAQNAEAVANGKIIASNTALTASEGGATLATGAFTTAIKTNIKAMITWMTTTPLGWLTMLVGGVFLAVKAYDALTVSVKEQKEKMEDSLSAYKDAKSELSNITTELENQEQAMDDLLAKEKLTYAEQGQLEELQAITRELRIQKDLAEKEEGRTQKEVAKDASDLFNKQFGNYDISENAINEYQNNANITGNNAILVSDEDNISSMIAGYRQFNDLLDEAYGSESQEDIDHFKSLTEGLKDSIFETAQELQEQQSNIADYYNTIKDIPYDDLTTEQKGIVDSYNSISDAIELIYQQLDSNTWKSMQIESVFDTEGIEKTKEELIEMVKVGEFDESTLQSYPKLSVALEQNKISASELRNELEALAEAEDNVKGDTFNDKYPISSTILSSVEQIARQLEPQFAKLGEAYKEIFTADGFTLDDVDNSMLEDIRQSFAEIEEEVGVAFDAAKLDQFFNAITDKSGSAEEQARRVQDAFNELATAYFYSTDTLEQLNSETADAIEKQLEEMGVQNAAEVVAEALTAKTEELIIAKEYLAQTGKELASATEEEQTAFILEQIEAGNCGEALALLQLKKLLVNSTQINTSADIQQIMNLASAAGMGEEVLTQLANAKNILSTVEAKGTDAVSLESYEKALSDVESAKQTMLDWKPVEVDFGNVGSGASKAGGAGKDAGDAYVDAFEEELKELQDLRDRGVIDEAEYLRRLRELYNRYFADRKEYLDEFRKYERQYLEGMKSLYDSALSGISKLMSNQIDGYNDAKEAAVSSLTEEKEARLAVIDAQKEQLEAEQDLIDEQIKEKQKIIDGIQKEIDAMKEAREERQRQLDLQKAQYELERMMHQRAILQYSEDKGMHYVNDSSGARDAKEKVDDAKFEIEIAKKEKEIKLIEEEIELLEEQKDAIQDQIDALDKQADSIEKYYSKMISEQEKYFDSLINNMEKQKSKWEELAEIEEIAKAYSAIEQVFGNMGYTVQDILNGNEQAFEDFKSKYISLLNDMNSNTSFAEGLSYATGVAEENLGSFLDKTKETADSISDLSAKGSELNILAEGMGDLADSATTANTNTGELTTSMGELGTSTEGIADNLTSINDALTALPEAENINVISDAFTNMSKAIKSVADALGVGEEGTVGGLVEALQSLSELSLGESGDNGQGGGTGIVSQFQALKTAVDDVTSAISGGASGGSTGSDASNSSSQSMSSGVDGENASGLVGAIESFKSATDEALGSGGEEGEGSGGTGAIPQFQELKTAIDNVISSIGIEDAEGKNSSGSGNENTLIGAIRKQYEAASEVLPEEKGLFEELLESIEACVVALNSMVNLIGSIPEIGGFSSAATNVIPHAKGTVGNAFAKGTGNYKGLSNREKNALVSEYGQTEMTVLPNGKTVITDEPTVMDLPKGTVIYNEEQTKKIMDNKVDVSGNAHADGTDDSIWTTLADGTKVRPLQPGDKMYDLQQKFEAYFKSIDGNLEKLVPNSYYEQNREWNKLADQITYANSVVNNRNVQPVINVGDVNVTCPGVTSQEVMREVGDALGKQIGHLAQRAIQEQPRRF